MLELSLVPPSAALPMSPAVAVCQNPILPENRRIELCATPRCKRRHSQSSKSTGTIRFILSSAAQWTSFLTQTESTDRGDNTTRNQSHCSSPSTILSCHCEPVRMSSREYQTLIPCFLSKETTSRSTKSRSSFEWLMKTHLGTGMIRQSINCIGVSDGVSRRFSFSFSRRSFKRFFS